MEVGINPDYDYLYDRQQDKPGTRIYEEDKVCLTCTI